MYKQPFVPPPPPICQFTESIEDTTGCQEPITHEIFTEWHTSRGRFCEKHADAMIAYYDGLLAKAKSIVSREGDSSNA